VLERFLSRCKDQRWIQPCCSATTGMRKWRRPGSCQSPDRAASFWTGLCSMQRAAGSPVTSAPSRNRMARQSASSRRSGTILKRRPWRISRRKAPHRRPWESALRSSWTGLSAMPACACTPPCTCSRSPCPMLSRAARSAMVRDGSISIFPMPSRRKQFRPDWMRCWLRTFRSPTAGSPMQSWMRTRHW
jgi:hypothetical protein